MIVMIRVDMWMLDKSSQAHQRPAMRQSYGLSIQTSLSLIIAMEASILRLEVLNGILDTDSIL